MSRLSKWSNSFPQAAFTRQRMIQLALGMADQGLSVGGMFLVNVALARTQTKEEYGVFALSYSIFIFLSGLHNAAVLEPFTVYGSGRYQGRFSSYLRLMLRTNVIAGAILSGVLLLACWLLSRVSPALNVRALLGLGLTVLFILTGSFLRRSFYVQREPAQAAVTSSVFFVTVAILLLIAAKIHLLNIFSVFLIVAMGWVVAGLVSFRKLPRSDSQEPFLKCEPQYWQEHWQYSRWVLATAFVFQFMHQGYYWLVAGFLSVREVGELKAMYVLIAPVEQIMISLSFLFLPALAAKYVAQNMDAFLALWKRYTLLMMGLTIAFALAVRLVGSFAIHLLYAGKFDELTPMLFLLALVPLLMGIGSTMSDAIRAVEKPRLVFYAYVSSAVATFVLGVPLVKYFGLRGAVYGMLVSAVAYSGTLAVAFRINVPKPIALHAEDIYTPGPPVPSSEVL